MLLIKQTGPACCTFYFSRCYDVPLVWEN